MMKMVARSFPTIVISTAVNSTAIDQNAAKATITSTVSETALQICKTASENSVRVNSLYASKMFTATDEARSVNEGFQPRCRVFMRSGNVAIHAETDNKLAASFLTVGKNAKVSSIITNVSNDYSGCSISLKAATF